MPSPQVDISPTTPQPALTLVPTLASARTIDLCAGPAGWEEGVRILGGAALLDELAILGIELNADACATARAAGHHRLQASITDMDPTQALAATGLIVSTPCPTLSSSGKRTGLGEDYGRALDAITCFGAGCGCEYATLTSRVVDPRTALVVEAARWALTMPRIEWMACEQVPSVEYLWEDLAAELYAAGWEWVDVLTFDALQHGTAARRRRSYLIARRYVPGTVQSPDLGVPLPPRTMAGALGWGPGEYVITRGNRRPTGGNAFSADGPSWCLTGKARTWQRRSDGLRLSAQEAGVLNGFPVDYPWTGSRTAQFQQAGDVVCPPAWAAVLGAALGVDWCAPVSA
ncbi:hypothetical protein GCM10027586_08290 [Kineococcus gypseus]|uniref:DNA cytosine methyltransferase n=1 Tax=Kineococcus gypseus TaxID=1637102 RepID=UPI003D7DA316